MPNGNILSYELTINYTNGSDSLAVIQFALPDTVYYMYTVQPLCPYQLVLLRLLVRTDAGISSGVMLVVRSDPTGKQLTAFRMVMIKVLVHVFFLCIAPLAVSFVNVSVENSSSVTVRWSPVPPKETNGILQSYRVSLWEYRGQNLQTKAINANASLQTTFTGLGMLICTEARC